MGKYAIRLVWDAYGTPLYAVGNVVPLHDLAVLLHDIRSASGTLLVGVVAAAAHPYIIGGGIHAKLYRFFCFVFYIDIGVFTNLLIIHTARVSCRMNIKGIHLFCFLLTKTQWLSLYQAWEFPL